MMKENGTPERKVRKRAEREDRILKAAEQLILAKGFANTTIDDIAAKADVSKGAVYLHYRTKDDIYFSIVAMALKPCETCSEMRPRGEITDWRSSGPSVIRFTSSRKNTRLIRTSYMTPISQSLAILWPAREDVSL